MGNYMERPFNQVYEKFVKFTPFVEEVFQYLNGYLNYENPCTLYIRMFSDINYAEFAKPNIIIVYLGSIVNNMFDDEDMIKQVIIMCTAHELSHSWQNSSMIQYTYDPYYKESMEKQNEGRTEQWILDHQQEIFQRFGVLVEYSDLAMQDFLPHGNDYMKTSVGDFYINTILDIIYRNRKFVRPLNKFFAEEDTIVFHINDSEKALLKYRGEYNYNALGAFNRIINKYCRIRTTVSYFLISLEATNVMVFQDTPGVDMHIVLKDQYYKPIEFLDGSN